MDKKIPKQKISEISICWDLKNIDTTPTSDE